MVIAVIADIVGSRRLADRRSAQRAIDDTIALVDAERPAVQRLTPTVGDELQGVYGGLDEALASLLALQLALPDGVALRFGIGIGEIRDVASAGGTLSDGPGWYAAREAIEIVDARERGSGSTRSWIVGAPGQDEVMTDTITVANAYLLVRDELLGAMSPRERRLAHGRLRGESQEALAAAEGVLQPAVSKALRRSGAAALLDGFALLGGRS